MVKSAEVHPRLAAFATLGRWSGIDRVESWCTSTRAIAGAVYPGRECNHQTGKSPQRSRELKILRGRFRFMLCPDPPGVSSKPFSRPQKVPRLNVTLADRCTAARKWTEAAFFARKRCASRQLLAKARICQRKQAVGHSSLGGLA